jgi:hypothetical protein
VPTANYAFLDLSNLDELGGPGPGQGGGLLIIRRNAFLGAQVVANPNTAGPQPAPVGAADLFGPPLSGYDATIIPALSGRQVNNPATGTAGVHEIGWSIFFIHGS